MGDILLKESARTAAARCSSLDLDHILEHTTPLWSGLRGEQIFVTGGTGFFGCWLLESLCHANRELALNARVTVLSRDPEAFRKKAPHISNDPAVSLIQGDAATFDAPPGKFAHVIHAAAESRSAQAGGSPLVTLNTIVEGTRRVLRFAGECGARRLLFVSSGAVYGPQPVELAHVPEAFCGAPDSLSGTSAYGQGKRVAESLCAFEGAGPTTECVIARCFAFLGPHLPLDAEFAAGNFIRDALAGKPIHVSGDGTPLRSYLYAADLVVWLWTILFRGAVNRAYNVGSEHAVSIVELANAVRMAFNPALEIRVASRAAEGVLPSRYVPSTRRAQDELRLRQWVELEDALQRTAEWHRSQSRNTG